MPQQILNEAFDIDELAFEAGQELSYDVLSLK